MYNLIGRQVTITDKDSWARGEWGIIKYIDNDDYYIAIANDSDSTLVFKRNEFRVHKINT